MNTLTVSQRVLMPDEFRRFRIAAGRIDIAAEAGAGGHEAHQEADGERDQHRNGVAGVEDQPVGAAHDRLARHADGVAGLVLDAGRDRDVVVLGVELDDLRRPGIGVDHRGRAEDRDAAAQSEERIGPDRAQRELDAPALATRIEQREHQEDAGGDRQAPAPERPDRGERPVAADQLEGLVHRRDGLAADDRPGDAAVADEAAQRDDEGRECRHRRSERR